MMRFISGASPIMILAMLALVIGRVEADGKKTPTIKEIMAKLNKPGGLHPTLATELKTDQPDWLEIQKQTKEFVQYALDLAKNEPRKGDKESWLRMTKAYAENAKALEAAAQKKDAPAAKEAHARLGGTACSACHKAHRPSMN